MGQARALRQRAEKPLFDETETAFLTEDMLPPPEYHISFFEDTAMGALDATEEIGFGTYFKCALCAHEVECNGRCRSQEHTP